MIKSMQQRYRPSTWAREITTATQGVLTSKTTPRIMVPPYRLNPDANLNRGLVAKYISLPGMTGGKYWYDLCGKNPGTLTNMASGYGWQGPRGRSGGWGAMRFDGSNDWVDCGEGSVSLTGGWYSISVCCWVNVQHAPSGYQNFISKEQTADPYGWSVRMLDGVAEWFIACLPSHYTILSSGVSLTLGQWYFLACIYTGSFMHIYIDGVLKESVAKTGLIYTTTGRIGIGGTPSFSFFSSNYSDDFSIYNRALSATEVAGLYEASKNQYRDEILCAYEV